MSYSYWRDAFWWTQLLSDALVFWIWTDSSFHFRDVHYWHLFSYQLSQSISKHENDFGNHHRNGNGIHIRMLIALAFGNGKNCALHNGILWMLSDGNPYPNARQN
jgi:hypothetical protein